MIQVKKSGLLGEDSDENKEIAIANESVYKQLAEEFASISVADFYEKPWFEDYLPMIREYYNIYGDDMVGFSAKKDGKLDIYLRCKELYEVDVKVEEDIINNEE